MKQTQEECKFSFDHQAKIMKIMPKIKKIEYEVLPGYSTKEIQSCYSFAFNEDASILFIGIGYKTIRVYEFANCIIGKEIQKLTNHTNQVNCLNYLKKSKTLVSGGGDKSIIIWNRDWNNQWKMSQQLFEHSNWIRCMIVNESEDLLISGSSDNTIKFWMKINQSWTCQQTIDVSFSVRSLSLNNTQKRLISCGYESDIKVMENHKQWIIVQIVKVEEWGFRLCFINNNQFIFEPKSKEYLEIYNFEEEKQKFIKSKQLQTQSCNICRFYFPCQFIELINILIVKHGQYVNIFKIDEEETLILLQSIEFDDSYLFGQMTDDGQCLITWDNASKQIQVRKSKILE